MKNYITSKTTGEKFEVNINLPYGPEGGANYSTVLVAGEERHSDWFVKEDGKVICICTFEMDGQYCELKGLATLEDKEMQMWIDNKISCKRRQRERTANYKAGQEFSY